MHSLFAPKAKASTASSNNVKLSSVTKGFQKSVASSKPVLYDCICHADAYS